MYAMKNQFPLNQSKGFKFFRLYPIHIFSLFQEWSIKTTTGYPVRGGFGHSSVWDHITNRIYVYGGNFFTLRKSYNCYKKITIYLFLFFQVMFQQPQQLQSSQIQFIPWILLDFIGKDKPLAHHIVTCIQQQHPQVFSSKNILSMEF